MKNRLEAALAALPEAGDSRIYIWGAGNTAMLFREGLSRIPLKIEAFVDNDPAKQGMEINGAPVISAGEMPKDADVLVLVCTGQPAAFAAVSRQLDGMGVRHENIDAVIFSMYRDEIREVFDSLADEESKRVYVTMLENRIACRFPAEDVICGEQYFTLPDFRAADAGETFIDCGAFVGDSAERYIWANDGMFKKIIAFEPDSRNCRAMGYRAKRLRKEWNIPDGGFEILPYAVGDEDSEQYVESYGNNNGLGSKMSASAEGGGEVCRTVTLEGYITDGKCFVKADIESYEYKLLLGAKDAVARHKPKLAICIYHNAVDFFSVPLLVKKLVPEYRLSIRHHSRALSDTVLYARI